MAVTLETFRTLIQEGQESLAAVELYDRPFEFEQIGRYVLVGVRQSGKSYILYKRAKQLLREGHSIEELVYIDFDDERLIAMTAEHFDFILQAYSSVYSHKPILLFDEIQNITGWEHFARRLANQKYQVFVTGSNARMLSRDIQTILGGRFLEERIYPYTFAEYLGAQGITLQKNWQYGKQRQLVRQQINQYLQWGGFPELLLYKNKRHWLNDLYEKILLGDIILRNGIKNELAMRLVMKRLAESVMQPASYNRLADLVKATGVNTTASSVMDYLRFATDACVIFSLSNYASKFAERESVKKHYFIDNGLLNIFLLDNKSALLENMCATRLYQQYTDGLYFYHKNIEVDFYIPSEQTAIQVSYSISDTDTRKRETQALLKLHAFEPLKKAVVITYEEEDTITVGNLTIEVVPLWKWLLSDALP